MGVQQQQQQGGALKPRPPKPVSEARRIRKPLMERKRRERINTSLNDLASLLTEARMVRPDAGGRPAKLEKADILELTVKHIRTLKEKGCGADLPPETKEAMKKEDKDEEDEEVVEKRKKSPAEGRYLAGFRRCMSLVEEKLQQAGKEALKERLLEHLGACLARLQPRPSVPQDRSTDAESDVKGEDNAATTEDSSASENEDSTAPPGTCLTLTPTRLSTGVLAFVVQGPLDPAFLMPPSPASSPSRPHSPSSSQTSETTTQPSSSSSCTQHQPSPSPPTNLTSTPPTLTTPTHEVSTSTHDIPTHTDTVHSHTSLSLTPYLTPSTHAHTPPTPPPSVSPFPSHQVEAMEVEEEGLAQDTTQPFDLSFRRMWRPW